MHFFHRPNAALALALLSCAPVRAEVPGTGSPKSGAYPAAYGEATTAPAAPATVPPPAASDPVVERAQALKEAGSLLEKAGAARGRGARSFAEQLFSSAELIVGQEALASLAGLFREGAPPRIQTPLRTAPLDAAPQPVAVGSSDQDEPEAAPKKASLSGRIEIEGLGEEGAFGVVTLEPASGKFRKRKPRQRVMEQRHRQFAPRMLVVPVGSTVSFPNFDPVFHNVFSSSEAQAFDLGIYRNGEAREVTFGKEGIIGLACNLHANMSAHIVVVSAPHYVITDEKGRYSFAGVEPGRYKLRAWSERTVEPVTRVVDLKPERNVVTVQVKGDAPKGPAPDKFGSSRGAKP